MKRNIVGVEKINILQQADKFLLSFSVSFFMGFFNKISVLEFFGKSHKDQKNYFISHFIKTLCLCETPNGGKR